MSDIASLAACPHTITPVSSRTGRSIRTRSCTAVLVLLAAILSNGCGQSVIATITVHHTLPDSTNLTRYAFVPLKDQETGIENVSYRNAIRQELVRYRYLEADVPSSSFLLSFSYGINEGRDIPPSGYFDPATFTEYRRGLWVFLYEKTQGSEDELKMVYEGSVVGAGTLMQVSNAMPAMIRALFREFPGDSGTTRKEYLDP